MEKRTPRATGSWLVASFVLSATFALCAFAAAAPMQSQHGLPSALVITAKPGPDGTLSKDELQGQIKPLQDMAQWARDHQPKLGFWERLLGSPSAAKSVPLDDLAKLAGSLKGQMVVVEGLYEHSDEAVAVLQTDRSRCLVDLAEGTQPEGFPGKDIYGLPAAVQGTVEMRGTTPVVRANQIRPSAGIALIRVARIYELLGDNKKAMTAYSEAEAATRTSQGNLGAFARVSAARLAYDARDKVEAGKYYNMAWNTYITNVPPGSRTYAVWMPDSKQEAWDRLPVREAIGDTLDRLNAENFWYRFVDLFVTLCGRNPALGVLLLSLVVRLIIWPLTKKQLQSAEAMKRLQPQMKELQARYADDKEKFQQEFWKLCQANGVNPLGGCLPLIVQMPILILIYKGIRLYIVQFDRASFLWVPNLGGPDMILLVAYTISMILFQKMTSKTTPQAAMDPQQEQQQKMMMYMMPLMFFFMFKTFPAAFILYWLGTNVIYFAQQWNYSRVMAHTETTPAAPARSGGLVSRMAQLLSGEPTKTLEDTEEKLAADNLDRRSMEDIRRDRKKDTHPKRNKKR